MSDLANKNLDEREDGGVDVICYGKREHFATRSSAIDFYLECMAGSEGSERERYTRIYLELMNTENKTVSDGQPEFKKREEKNYNSLDKNLIIKKINDGEIRILDVVDFNGNMKSQKYEDPDVLRALVKKDGWYAMQFLRRNHNNDKELIMTCINSSGHGLVYAHEDLQNDKELVIKAVAINGLELRYAGETLQNDIDVVSVAVSENAEAKQYIGNELIKKLVDNQRLEYMKDVDTFIEHINVEDVDILNKLDNLCGGGQISHDLFVALDENLELQNEIAEKVVYRVKDNDVRDDLVYEMGQFAKWYEDEDLKKFDFRDALYNCDSIYLDSISECMVIPVEQLEEYKIKNEKEVSLETQIEDARKQQVDSEGKMSEEFIHREPEK